MNKPLLKTDSKIADKTNHIIFKMEMKVSNTIDSIEVRKKDNVDDIIKLFSEKHNLSQNKIGKL